MLYQTQAALKSKFSGLTYAPIVMKNKEATVAVPRIIKIINIYPLKIFPFGTVDIQMNIHLLVNMHQIQ